MIDKLAQGISITAGDLGLQDAPKDVSESNLESILMTVFLWAGIVAVLVIIIGGIRYATSGGDPNGVKSAKNTILYAVVGLVVVIMASAITQFVIQSATQ